MLNQTYAPAISKLGEVHAKHLKSKTVEEQTEILAEFIRMIRVSYGYSGKVVALGGINLAETIMSGADTESNRQLKILLSIGRAVFTGEKGDAAALQQILDAEFATPTEQLVTTSFGAKPNFI